MRTLPIRLAFGAVLWRVFLVLAVTKELRVWSHLQPFLANRSPGFRVAAVLAHTPRALYQAFFAAAIAAVVADLVVRAVVRPILMRWYAPPGAEGVAESSLIFALEPGEVVADRLPARLATRRATVPGLLARTDRRLLFTPTRWSAESWSIRLGDVAGVASRPSGARCEGLLVGAPERVAIRDGSGAEALLVVADPESVLKWFPARGIEA